MKLKLVDVKLAKKLKEIGFKVNTEYFYSLNESTGKYDVLPRMYQEGKTTGTLESNYKTGLLHDTFPAPEIYLVAKWLEEKYKIYVIPNYTDIVENKWYSMICNKTTGERYEGNAEFKTPEIAVLDGITEIINGDWLK
jgi:hypothetical protein